MKRFRNVSGHAEDVPDGPPIGDMEFFDVTDSVAASAPFKKKVAEGLFIPAKVKSGQDSVSTYLTGEALENRARELEIEGRSGMSADQLREAIAEAEKHQNDQEGEA